MHGASLQAYSISIFITRDSRMFRSS